MHPVGVVLMAYGTPAAPERDPAATTPTSGAAARRATNSSPTSPVATTRSAGSRRCSSAPRPNAAPCSTALDELAPGDVHGRARAQARRSDDRGGGRPIRRAVAPSTSSALVLAPHYSATRSASTSAGSTLLPAPHGMPTTGLRVVGNRAGVRRLPRRRDSAPLQHDACATVGSFSPPIHCRRASSRPATRIPDELRATAEAVAPRSGSRSERWQLGWQSAGRTPEPWLAPTSSRSIDRLGADPTAGGRARVRLRFRRRPPRGAVRPRHRGPPARASRSGLAVRPHRVRQRRSGGDGGPGGTDPRARRSDRAGMIDRRVLVIGGGITGLAAAARLVDTSERRRRAVGGRRPARRQDRHLAVRRAGARRRGRRRLSSLVSLTPWHSPARSGSASGDVTSPTDATAMVWHDRHARRSPVASCSACLPRCGRSSPRRC